MKILLLNQTFHPDVASSARHLSDLAVGLIEHGHEVTVLTGRRAYDDPTQSFPREEIWHGIRIIRVASSGLGKASRWKRAADFASFTACCAARIAFLPRPDVVVSLTSPPLISVLGAAWAGLRRSRFIYWVMDLNPDEALAAGWLRRGSLPALCLEFLSRFSLRAAHRIIALDRFMEREILAKGIQPDRLSVIPPWSDDDIAGFDLDGRKRFRQQHGLARKFVVMHAGNHSPCHPLDTLLAAADRLSGDPSIVFCLVGGGSEWRRMRASGLPRNIRMLPYQPRESLGALLSAADLHVVVMGAPFVGLVHPCKIYNILRIGSPLLYIGPNSGPISELIRNANQGFTAASARHGDPGGLVRQIRAIRRACSNPPCRGSTGFAARFSRAQLMPRLIAEIEAASVQAKYLVHEPARSAP